MINILSKELSKRGIFHKIQGDFIKTKKSKIKIPEVDINIVYLLGIVAGDGSLSQAKRKKGGYHYIFRIYSGNEKNLQILNKIINKYFYTRGKIIKDKMNYPTLKGEVSRIKKMLKLTNPRLRRSNVVLNSFSSCISNTPKEFSWTPEMSSSKMVSQPRMFLHQTEGTVSFEQLKSLADTHSDWHLNEEMDMINSDVEFINFEPLPVSNLPKKKFTIHSKSVELKGVFGIFNFPDKMESILSEAMFSGFQIHFLSPKPAGNKAHANLTFISEGLVSRPSDTNHSEILNFEDGDSSQNLKVWVSSPWM